MRPRRLNVARLKDRLVRDKKTTNPDRWQSGTMRDRDTRGAERAKRIGNR